MKSILKELEVGLGTSKLRIIAHLLLNHRDAFTKYALVKATGLRTPVIKKQLEALLSLGWIKEHRFSPVVYQANLENPIVKHVLKFLQRVRYIRAAVADGKYDDS